MQQELTEGRTIDLLQMFGSYFHDPNHVVVNGKGEKTLRFFMAKSSSMFSIIITCKQCEEQRADTLSLYKYLLIISKELFATFSRFSVSSVNFLLPHFPPPEIITFITHVSVSIFSLQLVC